MTAAVAPFAIYSRIISLPGVVLQPKPNTSEAQERDSPSPHQRTYSTTRIRMRNLNTGKRVDSEIELFMNQKMESPVFNAQGNYVLDGVPGYGSPINLAFMNPAGSKTAKTFPTGSPVDELEISNGQKVQASLIDVSNPGVFIDGRTVGWNSSAKPEELNVNAHLMAQLEEIRQAGASMMGLDPQTPSIPKIVLLFPPKTDDVDITCQALSMEQAHKAAPVTLSLNLGVACKLPGTIPYQLARQRDPNNTMIGHPSGKLEVGAKILPNGEIESANMVRTARALMTGFVNCEDSYQRHPY